MLLGKPSLNPFWQGIGAQLRNPSGLVGKVTGSAMVLANAKPNTLSIAALNLREDESLLELGCGPGLALQQLLRSPHLARAIGLDWSDAMLVQASRRNRQALDAGRLALVRGDFTRLPFPGETVDVILAVNVVYFMDRAAVREARRVLRPGGRIVLYATDRSAMRRWPFAGRHTHRLFDRHQLNRLLIDAGFRADCISIEGKNAGLSVLGLLAVAHKEKGLVLSNRGLSRQRGSLRNC